MTNKVPSHGSGSPYGPAVAQGACSIGATEKISRCLKLVIYRIFGPVRNRICPCFNHLIIGDNNSPDALAALRVSAPHDIYANDAQ